VVVVVDAADGVTPWWMESMWRTGSRCGGVVDTADVVDTGGRGRAVADVVDTTDVVNAVDEAALWRT
jgi:selenophosphate synthetase-related protein